MNKIYKILIVVFSIVIIVSCAFIKNERKEGSDENLMWIGTEKTKSGDSAMKRKYCSTEVL